MVGLDFTDNLLKCRLILGKITFLHKSNTETWLGKNHHAEGILQKMSACMRAEYKKKTVLDLLIHPADTGKTTKTMRNVIFLDYLNITGNLHHEVFLLIITACNNSISDGVQKRYNGQT